MATVTDLRAPIDVRILPPPSHERPADVVYVTVDRCSHCRTVARGLRHWHEERKRHVCADCLAQLATEAVLRTGHCSHCGERRVGLCVGESEAMVCRSCAEQLARRRQLLEGMSRETKTTRGG